LPKSSNQFSNRGRSVAVFGVMLAIFLFAVDATIVGAGLPTIVGKLGGLELYSWVFSIYMLASALATPLFGALSDLYGRRRFMLLGIGLFTLGSALCGMAQTMEQLIAFRAVQGIGGGAIYALAFILIGVLFPPEKRAKMQALISGLWGIASILGPVAGAGITQTLSWRWIFFVNLPIGFAAALLIGSSVGEAAAERRRRLDLKGLTALLLGLLFLFYALEEARKKFFAPDPALIALALAASAALIIFFRIERRAREPVLPLELFRMSLFRSCLALAWLASMGMFGVIGYLPLYVQGALGGDAARVGIALAVASLGWTAGSFIAGATMNRFGYRPLCVAGMLLMVFGYGWFVGVENRLGLGATVALGGVIGVGMGIATLTSMVGAQNSVAHHQLGAATSTLMLARMLGGAFGIALMGSVLFSRMHREIVHLAAAAPASLSSGFIEKLADPQNLLEPATRAQIPAALLTQLVEILRGSIWAAFVAGFFVMLLALVVSLWMPASVDAGGAGHGAEDRGEKFGA
jgi:EmrB/QacA subfamily drug resistance transporter